MLKKTTTKNNKVTIDFNNGLIYQPATSCFYISVFYHEFKGIKHIYLKESEENIKVFHKIFNVCMT